ncbi:unnamed protein product [Soboliphyme baturini]|uniref:DNA_MISMATCH_REPAIR_2 domain-containing protein n=1 Tax=Soboliphyme baturini TaxID=241478 RepID=A0A183IXI5_9BILA|nr:unnamed protein product [Soboliphyme baturini]
MNILRSLHELVLRMLFSKGLFVPAVRAKIGPVDRIFSRVHTIDTVLNGMSTFANDVKQLAVATIEATSNSVVIVDEFGKGTLSEVGLSLLTSCLEYWLNNGSESPHVFASSHLHSLLKLIPERPFLKLQVLFLTIRNEYGSFWFQTMEVIKEQNTLTCIYQVVDGSIECSYAAYSALKAGLSEKLVKRAYEVHTIL